MTDSVKIIYKNKNVVIIEKLVGMPSQSDPSGDADAMSAAANALSGIGEQSSLWLVHRLDRTVGGLIAFARNKKSASELSRIIADGEMDKRYFAICHGRCAEGEYRDYLFKDSATGKSYIAKTARRGAKEAVLWNEILVSEQDATLCAIKLGTGRFHQIRAQFSSRGNSLIGDKKYGSKDFSAKHPALFACSLSFTLFGEKINASVIPTVSEYPWNKFSEEIYKSYTGEKKND